MIFIVVANGSKCIDPGAKDVVPAFLEAWEASVGSYGPVVKREEHKLRGDAKKSSWKRE